MTRLHEIVLQYNVLYCGWKGVQEAKLYRNTKLYCDRKARQLGRRWARRRGRLGTQVDGRAGGRRAAAGRRRRRATAARGKRAAGARQRAVGARPGRWARGRACCGLALGFALGLFSIRIDSVLFLSRFLDIVREPGS